MSEHIVETVESNGKLFIAWQERLSDAIREEIVRCRDCEYLVAHGTGCAYWDYCDIESIEGFCKWAKRREE